MSWTGAGALDRQGVDVARFVLADPVLLRGVGAIVNTIVIDNHCSVDYPQAGLSLYSLFI